MFNSKPHFMRNGMRCLSRIGIHDKIFCQGLFFVCQTTAYIGKMIANRAQLQLDYKPITHECIKQLILMQATLEETYIIKTGKIEWKGMKFLEVEEYKQGDNVMWKRKLIRIIIKLQQETG